ncbi:hypothetical protein VTN96DRAFT_4976 [Rasamsonia emersonii]
MDNSHDSHDRPPEKASKQLAGFKPVTPKIFLYEPASQPYSSEQSPSSVPPPTTIVIFAFADGQLRHLVRFTEEYKRFYPAARIIVVLSTSQELIFNSRRTAIAAMSPVVALLSPSSPSSSSSHTEDKEANPSDRKEFSSTFFRAAASSTSKPPARCITRCLCDRCRTHCSSWTLRPQEGTS